jgi:hypothetical protein
MPSGGSLPSSRYACSTPVGLADLVGEVRDDWRERVDDCGDVCLLGAEIDDLVLVPGDELFDAAGPESEQDTDCNEKGDGEAERSK